ncbi:MAG: glucosaminidase domain-containing protein [Bacilli bacterium]|nr:glucosaminidase domain-containing protein [Bacilli bacterium]
MKKYLIIFNILFIFTILDVNGLTSDEIKTRNVCESIELAIANEDKTLTSVNCFDNYLDAKNEMNNNEEENLVILERINEETKIIDAKYALVYLGVRPVTENTYYYSDSSLKTSISYMNHHVNYGATDGVFLELNYDNLAIKVKVNGVVGWLKKDYYKIIPVNFLNHTSYYQVKTDGLYHYYSKNIELTTSQFGRIIDSKPSNLNIGKYYSHDGNYFYSSLKTMINDYKNNNYQNSINKDNPYYNYYMYLPHRARSNYTSDDIDAYLKNNKGLIGTIYGKHFVSKYSNMYQAGIYFKSSESLYGANAILMMALATNESSLGQSSLAISKNNLFGHAAYDSDAYNSATGYLNPYQSIIGHANSYINCGYANPKDSRYYGSNVGNKNSGMNIKYASDPYWGEKVANYYYLFDQDNGNLDKDYYQLGVTNTDSINTRTEPNLTSTIPYMLKYQNIPVIILGEVEGVNVNGSTKWYKIVSDANLNESRTSIQSCSYSNYYNYNSYVYVHSSFIKKTNTTTNNKYNSNNQEVLKNYKYKEYSNGSVYTPKVGLITKYTNVFDTATMSITTKSVKKGHLATVFMEAIDENNQVVAYLITSDYSKNQKAWVSKDSLSFKDYDILKVNLLTSGDYLNVYTDINGSVLGSIYTDTYAVITSQKKVDNNLWLKISYGLDNTYAWINTNISSSKGTLEYTTNNLNEKPVITASDQTFMKYDEIDPLKYVTAYDQEDLDLTSKIKVVANTVDNTKTGTYGITYQVTDNDNNTTSKTIKVTIKDYQTGESLFMYDSIKHLSENKFKLQGFLGVKKQDNINIDHYILLVNQQTNKTYKFKMNDYKDYPYEMKSIDDDKTYNYSGGWFQGEIDLCKDNIPEGDYTIYIEAINKDTKYSTKTYFTNIAYLSMPRRIKSSTRGISFDIDYSYNGSPILLTIRDNHLLSYDEPTTLDPMYNFFNEISLKDTKLTINGTSHSVGVSYTKDDNVKREIIFENIKNFKRYNFQLDLFEGPYKVVLPVSDNKDKTNAWFKKIIDLKELETGEYAIYIKTTSNNKTYYGELIDVAYTDFSKINTSKFEFTRNDNKRLRLELKVK